MLSLMPWYYRLLAVSLVAIALFGAGYVKGLRHEQDKQKADTIAYVLKTQKKVDVVAQEQAKREEHTRIVTQTVTKEVVRYVQVYPDRIELPGAWRVLHDAAASNTDPASIPASEAKPVDDATALQTVSANYAECQRWRDQVIGWQAYYEAIAP